MNVFAFTFTLQGVLFKYVANQGVQIVEYVFFRNFFICLTACVILRYKKINPLTGIPSSYARDVVIRSVAGQVTFGLMNVSFALIPIGTAFIMLQTSPFWTSILACLIVGEKIRVIEILGIVASFIGVVMIGLNKQQGEDADSEDLPMNSGETGEVDEEDGRTSTEWLGLGLAMLAAWTYSVNSVFNRKLKDLEVSVIMIYYGFGGIVAAITYITAERLIVGEFRIYTATQYLILTASAIADVIEINSMTIAYQRDSSGFVSLLGFTVVIYGFLADVFIFQESIQPLELAGAILILAATVTVSVIKLCQANREKARIEKEGTLQLTR